jgi:hypothetical protein
MPVLPVLRLLRVGTLFSPAADVLASVAVSGRPIDATAGAAMAASTCLYAAGMVWNDIADRREDRVHRPERPLPAGQVSLAFALGLGTVLLALGLWLSPCRAHHATIAGLVLAYDFVCKRLDWLGALTMGTLRGLNLGTALALPDVLAEGTRTDLRIAAVCYGVYIVAVTVLGIFEDRPSVRARAVVAVQTAPPVAALCGLFAVQGGPWPAPLVAAVPILWFMRRNRLVAVWDRTAIRRSMTLLLLGTMLSTAAPALAAGRPMPALAIALCIPPARWIARRIALT